MDLKKRKLDDNGVSLPPTSSPPSDPSIPKLTSEDARKLTEPLTHEQLLDIIQISINRHPDILSAVRSIADRDTTQRKLFIRGLGWDTTNEGLRNLFAVYGDLEEAVVILDKTTGKSKGYGFVTFKHVDGAILALKEPSKKIDGRVTVTQLAAAGSGGNTGGGNVGPVDGAILALKEPSKKIDGRVTVTQLAAAGSGGNTGGGNVGPVGGVDVSNRKIYVANVPFDMAADRLLAHFSSYGEIEEGPLGFDKLTGKSRGFALFVYKTAEAAQAALVDPNKTIDGRQLSCKLAIEGKKKPGMVGGPGGDVAGDGHGMQHGNPGQYGGPPGGYGWFTGGHHGSAPPQMGHQHGLNSSMPSGLGAGGPGLTSSGGPPPSSLGSAGGGYGVGLGGSFGGSHYGGPGSAGYGAMGGPVGALGGGSAFYGRLPPSSAGMPSGGYPESGHYGLSASSAFGSQAHQQPTGTSPAPRIPPGGMYSSMPPYY